MKFDYIGKAKQFMDTGMNSVSNFVSEKKAAVKGAAVAVGTGAMAMAESAMAAIDVTGVNTAITNAETSAHSVGTTIIGVVAGLAVVAIVIGLVKKL